MKIKEVIGLTGLTDRAIRLYIENGLIAPENQRSYTGRNSYDFTDADVEVLRQIALLRKAEFSLEQIKSLQAGGEAAQKTLWEYLETKKEALSTGQKIVSALQTLPLDTAPEVSYICAKIESSLRDQPVPQEDLKADCSKPSDACFFRVLSALIGLPPCLLFIWLVYALSQEFLFPKLYLDIYHHLGMIGVILPFLLMFIVFFLWVKPIRSEKQKKHRKIASTVLTVLAVISLFSPVDLVFLFGYSPVYSVTEDPANYLKLGTCEQSAASSFEQLFPAAIPRSAVSWDSAWYPPDKFLETTKYYYKHEHSVDPYFDLCAEWTLPQEEYAAEKQRIQTLYANNPAQQVQWGDWVCYNYSSDLLEEAAALDSYYYIIFAYNDTTSTVRYIAAQSVDWGDSIDPYFLSLEW